MKTIRFFAVLFFITLIIAVPVFAEPVGTTGYIYIGDSRFAYMDGNTAFSASPNVWNVSVEGMGYGWLQGEAAPYVDNLKASNPQITNWYEIYGLGVNDITSIDFYTNFYLTRALKSKVILVSVNPVGSNCDRTTNPAVEAFNLKLRSTGLPYIDCYNYLMTNGYSTYDGTHFTPETNWAIKNFLTTSVDMVAAVMK